MKDSFRWHGKMGVALLIEGTVVSGTPVVSLAKNGLRGASLKSVKGILNGTTNYILCEMEKGLGYDEALLKAQELGYAETDPTGDVEGPRCCWQGFNYSKGFV